MLERAGLHPDRFLSRYPRTLSGGECQRAALARALYTGPRILLCDEPVSALDPQNKIEILDLLAKTREEFGCTILLVSHDLSALLRIADRIVVIENGRIAETVATARFFETAQSETGRQFADAYQHGRESWNLQ